jgi:integrase
VVTSATRFSKRTWAAFIIRKAFLNLKSPAVLNEYLLTGQFNADLSPHDLRHTFTTLALRKNIPVAMVSRTLGHFPARA